MIVKSVKIQYSAANLALVGFALISTVGENMHVRF